MRGTHCNLLYLIVPLLFCGCVDSLFDQYEHRYDEQQSEQTVEEVSTAWKPVQCTIDEVKFNSYAIKASVNEKILADIAFDVDDTLCAVGIIEHYLLDDRNLIASWDGVAAKVTVNGIEQWPDSTLNDFSSPVTYRLYASDGQYVEYEFTLEQGAYTGLPVASISTNASISSKEKWVPAVFKVSSQQSEYNDTYIGSSVKLRGNNSLKYKKKSYTLKLDEKEVVLGMAKHKKWCFVANMPDRTLLRNRVAYEIGSRLSLSWTPSTRYCELFVNNQYNGLYLIVEQIKVSKNRVNLKKTEGEALEDEDPASVGYLFEMDTHQDQNWFETAVREIPVNVQYPEDMNDVRLSYVQNYFKKIEQLLYMKEVPDTAYREFVDLGSYADYWIAMELTMCAESAIPGSVWCYKDAGGKLCAGPIWDFDQNTFNGRKEFLLYDYETTDFSERERSLWYSRMFRDKEFVEVVQSRWLIYRESLYDILDFIDKQADYIQESALANLEQWGTASSANKDTQLSWEEAVAMLKEKYLARWIMMDNAIMAW